ncbi:MAG: NTP transferase domain-containing protein [Candidatus Brocadia sp.]|nr:NTP transferase domain-containing protein [Candidatus Brocadia sp.]
MKAVILAGGKGTRLRPYTVSIPKPLVPLGEEPIIEIILRQLEKNGVKHVYIALGHLAELLKSYFTQINHRYKIKISFSREHEPLGTIGPLRKISGLNETFLVLNGDILTTLSFHDLIDFHKNQGAIATLAVHSRKVEIDYGVIDISQDMRILKHREKPVLDYLVGMGICVFEPEILNYIPENKKYDVPDLIRSLIDNGQKILAYVSDDYWMDIGRPDDYEKAVKDYTSSPEKFLK